MLVMPSLTVFNYRFTPRFRMTLLAALVMMVLIELGLWQIQRGHEKQQMLTAASTLAKQAPVAWMPHMPLPAQYQPLTVKGRLMKKTILLDNQYDNHRWGYHVISPLYLSKHQVLLIDRGWVLGDPSRQTLPDIELVSGIHEWQGLAYYPSKKQWSLGPVIEIKDQQLAVVEVITPDAVVNFLHKSIYPFMIHLDKNAAHGFVRDWPIVAMSPAKHGAYALQWFAMAFAVLVIYIGLNLKKK